MTEQNKKYVLSDSNSKPKLTDDAILQHKDFKKLKANYHKMTKPHYNRKSLYKNKLVFLALLLILLVVYLISRG
jgi:hypothetical protein